MDPLIVPLGTMVLIGTNMFKSKTLHENYHDLIGDTTGKSKSASQLLDDSRKGKGKR